MKKTLSILSSFVVIASFLFSSCQKERMPDSEALVATTEVCKNQDYPLILACLKDAGSVNISNDGTNVYVKVTINEYIDLAKAYSTPQSGQFVNGILDSVRKELETQNRLNKVAYKK